MSASYASYASSACFDSHAAPPLHVLWLDHVVLRVADTGRWAASHAPALHVRDPHGNTIEPKGPPRP